MLDHFCLAGFLSIWSRQRWRCDMKATNSTLELQSSLENATRGLQHFSFVYFCFCYLFGGWAWWCCRVCTGIQHLDFEGGLIQFSPEADHGVQISITGLNRTDWTNRNWHYLVFPSEDFPHTPSSAEEAILGSSSLWQLLDNSISSPLRLWIPLFSFFLPSWLSMQLLNGPNGFQYCKCTWAIIGHSHVFDLFML